MDPRAPQTLEFTAVREMVAEFAVSDMGRQMIREQEVMTSPETVRKEYALVREMMEALAWREPFPIEDLCDIRPTLKTVSRSGTYLEPPDLLRVLMFLQTVARVKNFFRTFTKDFPRSHSLTRACRPVPQFEKAVKAALTPRGEVADSATPKLAELRREMSTVFRKIEAAFERITLSPEARELLQEAYVTERKGRKVLPVKSEFRKRIPGIVHDVSISGGTVFVEPLTVVSLSNELTELAAREKEEIRQVLLSLSELLRRNLSIVETNVEVMAKLDMLFAKARFSLGYECAIPAISRHGPLTIENGRHPLLLKLHEQECVPLNISLGPSDRVLVISGPNAGGKTTAAKTIAVLSQMAQTATPVPASANSVLRIFEDFFADIGDNQDISLGVSTFTSHLGEIKRILERIPGGSLVVLDELGTATDPAEGAVLAEAILEELTERAAVTIVTSHLPTLKTLGLTRDWARSASMGLDPETEKPNFVLSMDVPGESSGLTIARQIGIPPRIIERAYSLMPRKERDLVQALEVMGREKEELLRASKELEETRQMLEKEKENYASLLQSLEAERGKLRMEKLRFQQEVLAQKEKIIRDARTRVEKMVAGLPSRRRLSAAREQLQDEAHRLREEAGKVRQALDELAPDAGRKLSIEEIREGMLVWARNLRQSGRVKAVYPRSRKVDLTVDGVLFNVGVEQVAELPPRRRDSPSRAGKSSLPRKELASTELNLVGQRVEKAIGLLDRFLNDAFLSGARKVRVIHGYGTGILRKAIRDFLAGHPLVDGFSAEDGQDASGGAVTVVKLK